MCLVNGIACPTVECIIEKHRGVELFEIAPIHARQAELSGEQSRCLRRNIEAIGVGASHDRGKPVQRFGRETELLDHHIESAELAAVAPETVLDIEWRRTEPVGGIDNL